jgi:hypothetical protein
MPFTINGPAALAVNALEPPRSRRFEDTNFTNQTVTLADAKRAVEFLRRFGIVTTIFYNPTFPQGTEYEAVDSENEKRFAKGDHLFLLTTSGVDFVNVDEIIQVIEDTRRPAIEKLQRILGDLAIFREPLQLPAVQKIVGEALEAAFNAE